MENKLELLDLVNKWIEKAQNFSYTDDERNVYYSSAQEQYNFIQENK